VFAGDADVAKAVSAGESGFLNQPRCGNFSALLECRIAGHDKPLGRGALVQIFMLLFGEHGILEKRAGALAIGIARDDEHALARADVAHGLARFSEIGARFAAFEMTLQVGIFEVRLAAGLERVGDAENDEAVTEAAGLPAQLAHLAGFPIEDFDRGDGLGNFLSVGTDILYRRAAHAAGDAAQAFDARTSRHDGLGDEAVPGFSRAHVENNFAAVVAGAALDAGDGNLQDQPGPAGVGYEQIAAATENKERQALRLCESDGFLYVGG